jgi:biotin transport system substrate-specific component
MAVTSGSAGRTGESARRVTTTALLAALLAASVLVTIPTAPVPITLQVFVVVLTALLVPPSWAGLAVGTYLIAGAVGLPVFAGFRGGLGVLLGPTGGFLFGFLVGAVAGAAVRQMLETRAARHRALADGLAAAVVIAIVYLLGWAQLGLVAHLGPVPALLAGVVPFLVPDALKAVAAVAVVSAVRRASRR